MSKHECTICGYVFEGDWESLPENWECPACSAPKSLFRTSGDAEPEPQVGPGLPWAEIPAEFSRRDGGAMDEIHALAASGRSATEPMETLEKVPNFDDILILGAQLAKLPLEASDEVSIKAVIGRRAERPLELDMPVYISHMSFGALSKEAKTALAAASAAAGTAMCSGEGGILPEERAAAAKYIFEYVPNLYGATDENLASSDAVEIKIGQGTKPGMGGHLPGAKVTPEIAAIRGKPAGRDILSPSKFPGISRPEDLERLVDELRQRSGGRPIGVKIAAGRIEEDLAFIARAKPDFITIDGRGGATGSSPKFLKDASSVPTVFALARARKFIDENCPGTDLVITGGLRTSRDFIKALAMGADAVAVASAALMALGCQRFRVCHNGKCPVGIATQDPELRARLSVDAGARRVENYLRACAAELEAFLRCMGARSLSELSAADLCTTSCEIASATAIRHA